MSCYACTRKYGIFCKESGCANCGYSFCLKCLKKEIEVPRRNNQKHKVCLRCYEKLEVANKKQCCSENANSHSIASKIEPNEIFQINDPIVSLGPILQPLSSNVPCISNANTNSEEIVENLDSEIIRRLNGLKTSDGQPLTDDNLRQRLCNLQGFEPKEYSKKDLLLSTDERSEQEKINDLLKQFVEETHIDSNVVAGSSNDALSDIEKRLAALRDIDPSDSNQKPTTDPNTPSDNEEDDENLLKNIIQRYVDEVRLPTPTGSNDQNATSNELATSIQQATPTEATEELPWCTICNEDADVRCHSCDGDLFCKGCFKECHQDDEEWRGHKTEPYGRPPTFKEDHF